MQSPGAAIVQRLNKAIDIAGRCLWWVTLAWLYMAPLGVAMFCLAIGLLLTGTSGLPLVENLAAAGYLLGLAIVGCSYFFATGRGRPVQPRTKYIYMNLAVGSLVAARAYRFFFGGLPLGRFDLLLAGLSGLMVLIAFLWYCQQPAVVGPGHCEKCGYNLTGNTSGRCPECGSRINPGPSSR